MKIKRILAILMMAVLTTALLAGCSSGSEDTTSETEEDVAAETEENAAAAETEENEEAEAAETEEAEDDAAETADYPTAEINGIVPWGAGGGTDSLMRPLSSIAETVLGQNINVQNMAGETGTVATQYVYDQEADGYNLLMSAENPALYEALGLSDLTYDDFTCILLLGEETTGVVVLPDSPYQSLTEIVEAALDGETVTLASTGVGGLPWEVAAMITSLTGAEFEQVEYDSDASAKEAVLDGSCDFTISKVGNAIDEYNSGDLTWLCVFAEEAVPLMADVPLVTEEYPDFAGYLPWGPFYGIFVKNGTDEAIVDALTKAYTQAYNDSSYQAALADYYVNALGYTGDEADEYIHSWQEKMVEALTEAGAIEE